MTKKCDRCLYDISIAQILEQEKVSEIICPNCGRKLVATDLSKVVTLSFFFNGFCNLLDTSLKNYK